MSMAVNGSLGALGSFVFFPQLSEAVAWEKAVAAGSSMPNAVKFESDS